MPPPQKLAKQTSASGRPRARRPRAPKSSSADVQAAEQIRAVVTELVQKLVKIDNEQKQLTYEIYEEEEMPLRMELLGEDREYNRYWWMASEPGRLWVETPTVGRDCDRFTAPVRAYCRLQNSTGAKASLNARLDAATKTLKSTLKTVGPDRLRDIALLCGVPCLSSEAAGKSRGDQTMYEGLKDGNLINQVSLN